MVMMQKSNFLTFLSTFMLLHLASVIHSTDTLLISHGFWLKKKVQYCINIVYIIIHQTYIKVDLSVRDRGYLWAGRAELVEHLARRWKFRNATSPLPEYPRGAGEIWSAHRVLSSRGPRYRDPREGEGLSLWCHNSSPTGDGAEESPSTSRKYAGKVSLRLRAQHIHLWRWHGPKSWAAFLFKTWFQISRVWTLSRHRPLKAAELHGLNGGCGYMVKSPLPFPP